VVQGLGELLEFSLTAAFWLQTDRATEISAVAPGSSLCRQTSVAPFERSVARCLLRGDTGGVKQNGAPRGFCISAWVGLAEGGNAPLAAPHSSQHFPAVITYPFCPPPPTLLMSKVIMSILLTHPVLLFLPPSLTSQTVLRPVSSLLHHHLLFTHSCNCISFLLFLLSPLSLKRTADGPYPCALFSPSLRPHAFPTPHTLLVILVVPRFHPLSAFLPTHTPHAPACPHSWAGLAESMPMPPNNSAPFERSVARALWGLRSSGFGGFVVQGLGGFWAIWEFSPITPSFSTACEGPGRLRV